MNDSSSEPGLSRDEMMSALFAQMVMQQANMAMMLLGKMPHPQSGEISQDLEAARMFIDQMEMLELKTRGNLNKDEENLLRQSLTSLRMAFVETVNASGKKETSHVAEKSAETATPADAQATTAPAAPAAEPEESKKKFSKKY